MKRVISIVFVLLLISTVNVLACGGSCRGGGSCGSNDSCGGGSSSCSCRNNQEAQQNVISANTEKIVKKDEVGNKICPIEGTKIGSMGEAVNVEYKSKIYNLCCGMCINKFKKNPKKYSKVADRENANNTTK